MVVKQLECNKKFDGDGMVATMDDSKTRQVGIQLGRTLVLVDQEVRLCLSNLARIRQGESPRSFK